MPRQLLLTRQIIKTTPSSRRSQDSVAGMRTDYGLDGPRSRSSSPGRVKNFLFSTSWDPPSSYPIGTGAVYPGVKRHIIVIFKTLVFMPRNKHYSFWQLGVIHIKITPPPPPRVASGEYTYLKYKKTSDGLVFRTDAERDGVKRRKFLSN
jgi:hypothetical protein